MRHIFLTAIIALVTFAGATSMARADCAGTPAAGSVLFLTDREPLASDQFFSGERGKTAERRPILSYGSVAPGTDGTLAVRACSSPAAFYDAMRARFPNLKALRTLVYVHGYYRSFRDAAQTTITLQRALHFPGPVILYSWPSKVTSRLSYINDESNADWSIPHFVDFIGRLQKIFPLMKISLASHSMGARFQTAALLSLRHSPCPDCLGPSVYFAPDIDSDTLYDELVASRACAGKPALRPTAAAPFTLYISNRDVALRNSQQLHGHQRAGQAGNEIVLCSGVDTIDVSYVHGPDPAGHTYQVYPDVTADAAAALAGISPLSPKRNLKQVSRSNGVYYDLEKHERTISTKGARS
jgi:esterase/lipase superfamily enzyme